ncbi:MAG: putative exopolysaccharide biosynthesis protein [Caloramator sp.]|jgi:capsular exopolysaccharide synthesis family protein|uniref:non-specific protein-tyrosine kinase n=1 Tax=Caloramator proteoclasticus DSM 10124 TaxID=1121262 RepID=A0A1M4WLW2_9CLOT|nr:MULTISPECIES: CpsD/CapB family tyrosine-protein kinase [Caloramator]MBZ4663241.1 putative exopolysaccharide biosynthesis protein [Caloramator sp.]SHE82150.1 capsular exopolysaccharide family [Caloramator proteoclasticus DSM 10124]
MVGIDLVTVEKPKSPIAEAYRTLRTNIQFSSLDKKVKKIVITSSAPGEGKTTTALNLSITLAQNGHKTLLLDCDMRKPSIHKKLKISNLYGISDLLVGEAKYESVIIKGPVENLDIITSGTKPPNPAELLSSQKMLNFISDVEKNYEYIIIDTPPVLMVTDAQVLSKYADGTILVVASGEAEKDAVVKAKELLTKVGANILGVVLNKLDTNRRGYYGYYYHYYYGQEQEKKKKKGFLFNR